MALLQRENGRLTRRLVRAEAIIDLQKKVMWTAPSGQPPFLPWRPPDARGEPPEGAWMHSVNGGPRHRELVLPKQHHFGSNISGVWGQSPHASAVVHSSSNIAILGPVPANLRSGPARASSAGCTWPYRSSDSTPRVARPGDATKRPAPKVDAEEPTVFGSPCLRLTESGSNRVLLSR
jgi:hypothetical protein